MAEQNYAQRIERRLARLRLNTIGWTVANALGALRRPAKAIADNRNWWRLARRLDAERGENFDPARAPIHFIYGLNQASPLPFYAYMAIRSAAACHPARPVLLHVVHEPTGHFMREAAPFCRMVRHRPFDYFGLSRFRHHAHKADVLRLFLLAKRGGIYLDIDTLCLAPLDGHLDRPFTAGMQAALGNLPEGLSNAVMIARPGAAFLRRMLRLHALAFRSTGRDDLWDFLSVRVPWRHAAGHPDQVAIEPPTAFCHPLWNRTREMLFEEGSFARHGEGFRKTSVIHLWNAIHGRVLDELPWRMASVPGMAYGELARRVFATGRAFDAPGGAGTTLSQEGRVDGNP